MVRKSSGPRIVRHVNTRRILTLVFHMDLYPQMEKIRGLDCADTSGARRYQKMWSRFEAAAHIRRTIRTF
jgi:hypothetical protein